MKNKKGFTIIELMAVVVILGIISSIALIGVSRYRMMVKEKELITLHSNLESQFDNKRIHGYIASSINFCDESKNNFDVPYSGSKLLCSGEDAIDNGKSVIKLYKRGDAIGKYNNESDMVKNRVCMTSNESVDSGDSIDFDLKCIKNGDSVVPSSEELVCIKLYKTSGEKVIDDFIDDELCNYLGE